MKKTKVIKDFDFYIDEYMYYCRTDIFDNEALNDEDIFG